MGYTVTSSSRRVVMSVLLALAIGGGVLRYFAPNPSTLRDVGTLLLVLWLPAVGNLVGYLLRKIPRRARPATEFPPGAAFVPQLRASIEATAEPSALAALRADERRCTILVGRRGFTARVGAPLARTLGAKGAQEVALELLHPAVALPHLSPGTDFHLLVGATAVAAGRVIA